MKISRETKSLWVGVAIMLLLLLALAFGGVEVR